MEVQLECEDWQLQISFSSVEVSLFFLFGHLTPSHFMEGNLLYLQPTYLDDDLIQKHSHRSIGIRFGLTKLTYKINHPCVAFETLPPTF